MTKRLSALLIAIPLLYYFALIVGAATYPGYSHMTRYASELGAAGAPYPWLFNVSIVSLGIAAILASLRLPKVFRALGAGRVWSMFTAIALAIWGVSMVMGGVFPMPDERHGAFGLGLVAPLIPLFALLALGSVADSRGIRLFLAMVFVASIAMLAIMFGVGELVTRANVGLYQRLNTAVSIPWFAVLGAWLHLRATSQRTTA